MLIKHSADIFQGTQAVSTQHWLYSFQMHFLYLLTDIVEQNLDGLTLHTVHWGTTLIHGKEVKDKNQKVTCSENDSKLWDSQNWSEHAVYLEQNPAEHEGRKNRTIILQQRGSGSETCSGTVWSWTPAAYWWVEASLTHLSGSTLHALMPSNVWNVKFMVRSFEFRLLKTIVQDM